MSVYYPSFNYLGKNSKNDMGLVVSHLDGGDSGEVESFLSMDPIYTDNYSGTRRIDYGAKYNSVAVFNITIIKKDGGDFSVSDVRNCFKWLTGAQSNSNLDLLIDDEVKYTFTGRFTNASHYKMDARTIGLVLEFTSIAPWAYAVKEPIEQTTQDGTITFNIDNDSDDLYSRVFMKTTYTNTGESGSDVVITNTTTGEETKLYKLAQNETVTMEQNMLITSDNTTRIFGNDFNFVFPSLKAGLNTFRVQGDGIIKFEYIVPVKLGNVAMDINVYSDPICDENGMIQVEMLPWDRISGKPDLYTKDQIDTLLKNFISDDVYTKKEIDDKFDQLDIDVDVDLTNYYTKDEVATLLSSIQVEIDEEELNTMLSDILQ